MGGSGKWIKSIIGQQKPQSSDHEKEGKGKKWKLWRTGSGRDVKDCQVSVSSEAASDYSSNGGAAFNAAVAAVIRAPAKDFMEVRREWATLRIQTVFRAFLARQALRALKAVVRIQAIFRGRLVRKKAEVTYKCMQALVRAQERARAQTSSQSQPNLASLSLDTSNIQFDPTKLGEDQWCNSPGTIEEVRVKLQMKHQGAVKRERANAYEKQLRASRSSNSQTNKHLSSQKLEKNGTGSSWLDRWMSSKPWETKSMDEINSDQSETTRTHKKQEDPLVGSRASFSELESVKIRRNNISTRISAKPPMSCQMTLSPSDPYVDESSTSASSLTMGSNLGNHKPNYMNPTKSIKAKQRATPFSSHNLLKKQMQNLKNDDLYSVSECKDLYPTMHLDRYDFVKSLRE